MESSQLSAEEQDALRLETDEWLESLDYVIRNGSPERVKQLLRALQNHAAEFGIQLPYAANTPYVNTIARQKQPYFPGNQEIEHRVRSLVRWNALAMVVRANRNESGIGGHISTYASCATLLEIGFNHFFHAKNEDTSSRGDLIYFQGHAAPGIYARAFLEGRFSEKDLENFRRELKTEGGLSSYPHPYCMPDFWEFPTVSMGLGPIMAIYQARFNRYLEDRGFIPKSKSKVWAFIGDGESDEPETLGAITLAAREKLDNLIFVVNCNLQRLDGPVRGNYKIIQELEAIFRGAGWNVIKLIWGSAWDPLLEKDEGGALVRRMEEAVDGEYQMYSAANGAYVREHFFGVDPRLQKMVEQYSDEEIMKFNRGGHDPEKVYAAYRAAVEHKGAPTVILAKTIKGYGLGEAGEGKNISHQQKKLNEEELRRFRSRFGIPISDEQVGEAPFYKPSADSEEIRYILERREMLGGSLPKRRASSPALKVPSEDFFSEFYQSSEGREVSTTMVLVRILTKLLRDPDLGTHIVPIIPDEARTFGMEALFRQVGIYSHIGQKYEPVDKDTLLYYKEAVDGQIIEEGITEAGAISSFIAAGTAYSSHNINMIPFFIYYSMFGFQRIGDFLWAAGDMGCRGFLVGGTAGRTTLAGEGLQHQDGHSHLLAYPYPHIRAYDPTFAYEIAVIVADGLEQMFAKQKNIIYYITVGNEPYEMPAMPEVPEDLKKKILKGLYLYNKTEAPQNKPQAKLQLLASGSLFKEALRAVQILTEEYQCTVELWSVTSYKQLFLDLMDTERQNRMDPESKEMQRPYISQCLGLESDAVVAVSDYTRALPLSLANAISSPFTTLGTDGFGRSDSRESLRIFFEVNSSHIVLAFLSLLTRHGKIERDVLKKACQKLNIDFEKTNPAHTHWA